MVQKRDIAICVILSIVTCGIYGLYWFYCLHNDTNTVSGNQDNTSAILAIVLTIITCGIYGWYWCYKRGKMIEDAYKMRGMVGSDKAVVFLILAVFGLSIVVYALAQNDLNKLSEIDGGNNN